MTIMIVSEMVLLAGFRNVNSLCVLRQRQQLPFDDGDSIATAGNAYRLVVQSELSNRGALMADATNIVCSAGRGFYDFWPQIVAGPLWLVASYDVANIATTDETVAIFAQALRNGSRQRGWPVNLHEALQKLQDRADYLGIELPPIRERDSWWPKEK